MLILINIAYLLFLTPQVQTKVIHAISKIIEKRTNHTIKISAVDFSLKGKLILKDIVLIKETDTLASIHEITSDIGYKKSSYKNKKIHLEYVHFAGLKANIRTQKNGKTNFQELFDKFSSNSPNDGWDLTISSFGLSKSTIQYINDYAEKPESIFDYRYAKIDNLKFEISNFFTENGKLFLNLENLQFTSNINFSLNNLNTQIYIGENSMSLNNFSLRTNKTTLNANFLELTYQSYDDFSDFFKQVKINASIGDSRILLNDLSNIIPDLKGNFNKFRFEGAFTGTLSDFKAKNFKFKFAKDTYLEGDFNISGLPNIYETFMLVDLKELTTVASDIEAIQIKPFKSGKTIKLPKQAHQLGNIAYKGNITGFYSDIVAYGKLTTNAGQINSDILINNDTLNLTTNISGKVQLIDFDLGEVLDRKSIVGKTTLNLDIKTHISQNKTDSHLNGNISSLHLYNYTYHNIDVKGDVSPDKFIGKLNINDTNLKLEFDGNITNSDTNSIFKFNLDVAYADLYKTHILEFDTLGILKGKINSNFIGSSIDDFTGAIAISDLNYKNSRRTLTEKSSILKFEKNKKNRKIDFISDYAQISVDGTFSSKTILGSLRHIAEKGTPALAQLINATPSQSDELSFTIEINNANSYAQAFYPKLAISDTIKFSGYLDSKSQIISLSTTIDSIQYKNTNIKNIELSLSSNDKFIELRTVGSSVYNGDKYQVDLNTKLMNDSIKLSVSSENNIFQKNNLIGYGTIEIKDSLPFADISFNPIMLSMADTTWRLSQLHLNTSTKSLEIKNFKLENNEESINIQGIIGQEVDSLHIGLQRVNLNTFNKYIPKKRYFLNGHASGYAIVTNFFEDILVYSDLYINNLKLNKDVIGNVSLKSNWEDKNKRFYVELNNQRGRLENIDITGYYYLNNKMLDLYAKINNLDLAPLDNIFGESVQDLHGLGSANLYINGTLDKPLINGKLDIINTSFKISYLNTAYTFKGIFDIVNNTFTFDKREIFAESKDNSKGFGYISGNFSIPDFRNFNYDLLLETDRIATFQTGHLDNDIFYGNIYYKGLLKLYGDKESTNIELEGQTAKDTRIFIPYEDSEGAVETKFLEFVSNKKTVSIKTDKKDIDLSNISLSANIEVTPDAEVQLILDEKIGDIIKAKGSGDLRMVIDKTGSFKMYGDLTIEKGDYLFTFSNIINKKLDIESGSTITWAGDPVDANIDLVAIYRLKTSLGPLDELVSGLDSTTTSKRANVECHLKMTNKLMTPELEFEIVMPNTDERYREILESLSTEVKTNQFFYLLVLNSFYFDPSMTQALTSNNSKIAKLTGTEWLSNQISRWISQNITQLANIDFGLNYQLGDEISADELQIALSSQINERINVNLNGQTSLRRSDETQDQGDVPLMGDVSVEVKITKNGKLKVKGFTRMEDDPFTGNTNKQGIGMFYREDFNQLSDLFNSDKEKNKKSQNDTLQNNSIKREEDIELENEKID